MRSRAIAYAASLVTACATILVGPGEGHAAAPVRECGDAAANHPRAGVFNVTSRVTRCSVARGVAVRFYFRGQQAPLGYRCRVRTVRGGWDVRCTKTGGRVVRFQYVVRP